MKAWTQSTMIVSLCTLATALPLCALSPGLEEIWPFFWRRRPQPQRCQWPCAPLHACLCSPHHSTYHRFFKSGAVRPWEHDLTSLCPGFFLCNRGQCPLHSCRLPHR